MSMKRKPSRGLDAQWHAALGQVTGGLSPAALATAYLDWWLHMIGSPEKQAELIRLSFDPSEQEDQKDPRFADPAWEAYPFNFLSHSFLAAQNWWNAATTDVHGVDPKHANIVNFATRQWLDMFSPANFAATNPLVHKRTQEEGGQNLLRGARYWMEDFNRLLARVPRTSGRYEVGKDLAATPGDVVMRNGLVELIRYRPTTAKVHAEPILIVPAWIMKYYILDLTTQRSLVAYLRDQGFEVFILSWKNPDEADADLSMQDYIDLGVRAAIRQVKEMGHARMHAAGYCLGGTLLSIVAAAMARDGDDSLVGRSGGFLRTGGVGAVHQRKSGGIS
jgi:polyhydroxyalkanoate synthase